MYKYNATVDRVVDGDTVDAFVDLGFSTWKRVRIRLMGIDAWESRTRDLEEKAKGLAAKEYLVELFKLYDNKFVLQSHGVGKYGRCLGELFVGEININEQLITEGHAKRYYGGKR